MSSLFGSSEEYIKICQFIFPYGILLLSSLGKGHDPYLNKLEFPKPKDTLILQSLVEIGPVDFGEDF